MPGLKAFLQKTMIFTAAAPADLYGATLGASDAIVPTAPVATKKGNVEDHAVWSWTHDPSTPAKITNLNAIVRAMNNMTLTVCDSIEVERVAISLSADSPVVLTLDVDHVVAKFQLDKGHIPDSTVGWWRLEATTDWSMAVVFAFEIVGEGGRRRYARSVSATWSRTPRFPSHRFASATRTTWIRARRPSPPLRVLPRGRRRPWRTR